MSQTNEEISRNKILNILKEDNIQVSQVLESSMLYLSRQSFTKILTRIKLFEKILDVQGSVVECGVYKADSLLTYFHLSNIYEPYSFTRKIIGFDTFEGFPTISKNDSSSSAKIGHLGDTNLEHIKKITLAQELNKAIPSINKIELIKGDAEKTIPSYLESNPHLIISLLYLDFDLYQPTKTALQHLLPRVPIGGIVGFDELNQPKWAGETQALSEIIGLPNIRLKKFVFDPHVSFFERVE